MAGRLTEERCKAIAQEYIANGYNKSRALISCGYKDRYATTVGLKIYDDIRVKAEIDRIQAITAKKVNISVEGIQSGLADLQQKAIDKGDLSTAARCYELLGRTIGAYTDNINSTDTVAQEQAASRTAEERESLRRLAGLRLAEISKAG